MNVYPHFLYFVIEFGETRYKEFPLNAIEEFWVLWKSVQWNACFDWRATRNVALLSAFTSNVDKIRYNGCPQNFIERICVSGKAILHWICVGTLIDFDIFVTAIGLSPGGSSTVHIYTQTIHRTAQNKQYIEQHNNLGECGPCPVLASYTVAFVLQLRKKHGKTSVRVAS